METTESLFNLAAMSVPENAAVPASAVFPEHRGVILLTIRTWLRDLDSNGFLADGVPLLIQPGESVEFSFAGNPAPDDINIRRLLISPNLLSTTLPPAPAESARFGGRIRARMRSPHLQ